MDWLQAVFAGSGACVAWATILLSRRGQRTQQREQAIANALAAERDKWARRGDEFDRMARINDTLASENARLLDAIRRKESAVREWGPRWHAQLQRCAETTDALRDIIAATSTQDAARLAHRLIEDHRNADHIEIDESGE